MTDIIPRWQITNWNYRTVFDGAFRICEVYYNEDGSVSGWCNADLGAHHALGELVAELEHMSDAFSMPVMTVVDGKLVAFRPSGA